jgi:alkyldihydroxyacetonephosphate synthase
MDNLENSKTQRRLEVLSKQVSDNIEKNEEKQNQTIEINETAQQTKGPVTYVPLTSVCERDELSSPNFGKNLVTKKEKETKWNGWGYKDTEFLLRKNGVSYVTGNKYLLSGKNLPNFRGYFQYEAHVDFNDPSPPQLFVDIAKKLPQEPILCHEFLEELKQIGSPYKEISFDLENRLYHSHGHTAQEIYKLRFGTFKRIVDVVIYPSSHSDVVAIVKLAQKYPVSIIPFGGGTSVTHALLCPEQEKRMIISLDVYFMKNIKWVDLENNLACVEAGCTGVDIDEQLAKHKRYLGHEPDSYEKKYLWKY